MEITEAKESNSSTIQEQSNEDKQKIKNFNIAS